MFHPPNHKRIKTLNPEVDCYNIQEEPLMAKAASQNKKLREMSHRKNVHYKIRSNSHMKGYLDVSTNSQKLINRQKQKIITSSLSNKPNESTQKDKYNYRDYQMRGLIGKGTFGKIFECYSSRLDKIVAIKKIFQDGRYQNRELDILKLINHQNLIKLLDHYYQSEGGKKYLYLVMNVYDTDLYRVIQEREISPMLIKIYLFQILKGLEYLNSQLIAHRDLKPHNILVNKNTHETVICDFGSAKRLVKSQKNIAYICARCYRAPELIMGATEYTTAVDMWALGCIMAEIINKKPFFQASSNSEQMTEIMKVFGTPTKEDFLQMNLNSAHLDDSCLPIVPKPPLKRFLQTNDEQMMDLIERLLTYSPKRRWTAAQALNHPYFAPLRSGKSLKQLLNAPGSKNSAKISRSGQLSSIAKVSKSYFRPGIEQQFEGTNIKKNISSDKLDEIKIPRLKIAQKELKI